MKNNIDYYRHESNSHHHPKFKTLRVKYGWEGEGRFWALNNMIAQADNCHLDLNKTYNRSSISLDLNMSLEDFDEFIGYLHKQCNLLIIDSENVISTNIITETLQRVSKERDRNKVKYEKNKVTPRLDHGKTKIHRGEKIQSKVKESKGKESIIEEEIAISFFEEFWKLYPRKVDKNKASSRFTSVIRKKHHEDLIRAVNNFCLYVAKREMKHIKHCSTWLSDWEQYIDLSDDMKKEILVSHKKVSPTQLENLERLSKFGYKLEEITHEA